MARDKRNNESTPGDYMASSTPDVGFGSRHDQTQVFQMLMEIHGDLGQLKEKIDGIGKRLDKADDKVSKLHETVIFVKGALYVGGPLLAAAIILLWWFVGDQVNTVFKRSAVPASPAAASAPFPPAPPVQLPPPGNVTPPEKK